MATWTGIVDLETLTPDVTTDGTIITQVNAMQAGNATVNTTLRLGQIPNNKLRVLRMNNPITTTVNPDGSPCIDFSDTLIIKTAGTACFDKVTANTTPLMRWRRVSMSYPAGGAFLFMQNDNRVQTIFDDVSITFNAYAFAFFGREAIWNNVVIRANGGGDSFPPNLPLEINGLKLYDHASMKLEHGSGGMYSVQMLNSAGVTSTNFYFYSGFTNSTVSDQTDRCMHLLDSPIDATKCSATNNGAIGTWRTLKGSYKTGAGVGVASARLYAAYSSGTSWVDYRLSKTRNMGVNASKYFEPYGTADQDPLSGAQTLRWLYILQPGDRVRVSGFATAGNNLDTVVLGKLNATTGKYYATADRLLVQDSAGLVAEGSKLVTMTRLEPLSTAAGAFQDTRLEIGFARSLSSQGANAPSTTFTLDAYQNGTQTGVAGQTFKRESWETYIVPPYPYRREVQQWTIPQSAPSLGSKIEWNVLALQDSSITVTTAATVLAYTALDTAAKACDYKEAWKRIDPNTLVGGVREGFFTISGNALNFGAWNVVVDATAASVWAVNTATNTVTIKAATFVGNITTTGTVTFANGAVINGIYKSSAGQSAAITITSNQAGARLRLLDNASTQQFNAVVAGTSTTLYFPPTATGSWTGAVELYGYGRQTFSLTLTGGGAFAVAVTMLPDTTVSAALATVAAYTALDTSQKLRDWLAYYNQTATGIAAPLTAVLTASSLAIGALTLAKGGTLGVAGGVLTTGATWLSGVSIVTTGTQATASLPALAYPQQFTDSTGTTNWLKVNLVAGQVAQDSYSSAYQTASYTTFLPAAYTSATALVITQRGYKKQSVTVPYATSLLAAQSATLIPDASVVDTTTDFLTAATALTNEQQMYDAYSQYQATSTGILDTYLPNKSPGALDFGTVAATFSPSATSTITRGSGTIAIKVGTVASGAYYSTGAVDVSAATLANGVQIRAANLDSELIFTANSLTLYPNATSQDTNTNAGPTSTSGIIRFKYGATTSGVLMSGTQYTRANVGIGLTLTTTLNSGNNVLDLTSNGQFAAMGGKLDQIKANTGLIPALL